MKTEQFILQEISRVQDRITMLSREYSNKRVKLNERGIAKYQQALESLRDAVNHLKIASVNETTTTTLEKIKAEAESLIQRGAPFTKDELAVLKMATPSGKAFNAGKRNDKHFQQTGR